MTRHPHHFKISFALAIAAGSWGIYWLPQRILEDGGLTGGWGTISQMAVGILILSPVAIWRVINGKSIGLEFPLTGFFVGSGFVCYALSFLLTDVVKALINSIESEKIHQAFIFSGTRGVGKTTIARILAKCLNCESGTKPTSKPCNKCSNTTEITAGRSVDFLEIDAASNTQVEKIRDLIETVEYKPAKGRYKIFLIDEVHMLSTASFNALLKTLEEPPPHVVFIFATTNPEPKRNMENHIVISQKFAFSAV